MPVETHGPEIASRHPIACAGASCRAFPKSIRSCRRKAGMPNRVRGQKQKRQPSSGRRFQEAFFHAVRSFTFPIAPLQGRREPSGLREPQAPLEPSGRQALQGRRELPPPPADPLRTRGTPYRKTSHWRRAKHPPPKKQGVWHLAPHLCTIPTNRKRSTRSDTCRAPHDSLSARAPRSLRSGRRFAPCARLRFSDWWQGAPTRRRSRRRSPCLTVRSRTLNSNPSP